VIISVRGASGSGKSHLAREIMALYKTGRAVSVPDRRQPLFYIFERADGGRPLGVIGHYEIANGGVDTLTNLDQAYAIARGIERDGEVDVLMEGKCMSDGAPHVLSMMQEGRDVRVAHIVIPIEQCVASVRERGHQIKESSIAKTHGRVERSIAAMRRAGVPHVASGDRIYCLRIVREWLAI
jgi:ABC-type dipeptide/oligopeptide/nickel transport system ATPase component